jgi:polysaccharide chain length determinant protein (PEP-CTERM system associated)
MLASVVLALRLPAVYSSTGTILVESQQIPNELIRSTVTSFADERIQIIQQLVMTRKNLLRLIEKYNLFADERGELTVSEQIDLMHAKIKVAVVSDNQAQNRGRATTAFTVSFEDRSPDLALAVTNELVTLFLEENVRSRTARASETTEFLRDEAEKLKHRLEVIEEQMASYKQENSEALPEHLDLHMNMLERTENAIEDVRRDIETAEGEYRFLEVELSAIRAGMTNSPAQPAALSPSQQLRNAEAELARLEARYSPLHPDVKRQKSEVAQLQEKVAKGEGDGDNAAGALQNIEVARVRANMASVDERIKSLREQHARLEQERSDLEAIIIQTPQVQRALIALNRDRDNMLEKYNEIQAKEMEARLSESLEEEKKAERFLLLEPPLQPDRPIRPDRKKIVAMGLALALAASVGLVVLIEIGDPRLFGVNALIRVLDTPPLAIIPYIDTAEELEQRKRRHRWLLSGGLAAALLFVVAFHLFLMPLDMLAVKLMAKIG